MKWVIQALVCLAISGSAPAADEPWKFQGALEFQSLAFVARPNPTDTYWQGTVLSTFSVQRRWDKHGKIFFSGAAEIDSHHDVARTRFIDWNERDLRTSVLRVQELYWERRIGPVDLRMGRQQIRWGRADAFNPTDNLEPYDFLAPFSERRLPVTALKADLYLAQSHVEAAWIPFYAPSRLPLLGQRWFPRIRINGDSPLFPGEDRGLSPFFLADGNRRYPALRLEHSQGALRWNVTAPGGEFSVSYYDGINDLPFVVPRLQLDKPPVIGIVLNREYHRQRILGADFAGSLGAWGTRGEAAYVISPDRREDAYVSYVLGLDRQKGRWFTILQWAGQWLVRRGTSPQPASFDRGLGRALLLRTQYELRTDESLELLALLRLPAGDNAWRLTYSRKLSDRWQLQLRGLVFAGTQAGFLGQYRDSSHMDTRLIYRW